MAGILGRYMRTVATIFSNPALGVLTVVGGLLALCVPVFVWCAMTGQDFYAFAEQVLHSAVGLPILVLLLPLAASFMPG